MIIDITLKDPDGVYDSIRSAAEEQVNKIDGLEDSEREELADYRHAQISESLKPWIEDGEYVRLQIDTEKKTATVILNK